MREVPRDEARPRILGMHLEGPFLSPNRLGTHEASSRRDPDVALLDRLLDAGTVRLMTLAPELPGAELLIDRLLERGIAVSLGHSDATAAQANAAFDRGARSVTHIFNAMRPFLHRDPGHRRCGARAQGRRRLDHPRRDPPRARDGAGRRTARRRAASHSSPTRSRRPASRTAPTASATSTCTCTRAPCAARTASSRGACSR